MKKIKNLEEEQGQNAEDGGHAGLQLESLLCQAPLRLRHLQSTSSFYGSSKCILRIEKS